MREEEEAKYNAVEIVFALGVRDGRTEDGLDGDAVAL